MSVASRQKYSAVAVLVFGALAVPAGSPDGKRHARVDIVGLASAVEREDDHVTAVELATWIRDRRPGLRIIDVRDSAEFDVYHIPLAERMTVSDVVTARFGSDETIVLYSEGGAHAAQSWVFLRGLGNRRVYYLRGGLYEWIEDVINPSLSVNAPDSVRNRFEEVAKLSRYFGGVPTSGESVSSPSSVPVPGSRGVAGAATAATANVRRRGC